MSEEVLMDASSGQGHTAVVGEEGGEDEGDDDVESESAERCGLFTDSDSNPDSSDACVSSSCPSGSSSQLSDRSRRRSRPNLCISKGEDDDGEACIMMVSDGKRAASVRAVCIHTYQCLMSALEVGGVVKKNTSNSDKRGARADSHDPIH